MATALISIVVAGFGLYLVKRIFSWKRSAPLPPGPPGWPIIGNLFDFPSEKAWIKFAELSKEYGDIYSMNVLGTQMIILNSAEAASHILGKHSAISSNRPHFTMANDLVGWKDGPLFIQYGERFRQYRKLLHQHIGTRNSLATFFPVEEEETRRFLTNVLKNPDDLTSHIHHTAGAVILKISHGYNVKEVADPFIELANEAMERFSAVATPGAYAVDIIPALRYLPEWFPGAGFQREARHQHQLVIEMVTRPYQFVLDQLAQGTAYPSFTSKLIEDAGDATAEEENINQWVAMGMYLGGSDTNVSAICSFFLAMTIYPEVQKRAQAELDAVVGTERLPTFEDRDALPYINAICKEVLRWYVVAPLAVPHVCTEDIIYDGFLIPQGSSIIPDVWRILHDETVYTDPGVFNPERFLGDNSQPDPQSACFGYGRRICPGLHLAEASIFISVAMSLAVFDVSRHVENGVEVIPEMVMGDGTVSHPGPFKCKITPRSARAEALIRG